MTMDERTALAEQLMDLRFRHPHPQSSIEVIGDPALASLLIEEREDEPPRRGRPSIGSSRASYRTNDSFEAFLLVQLELQTYRRRIGKKRVPDEACEAFISHFLHVCPEADPEIIREHLRKVNTYDLPEEYLPKNWRGTSEN